MKRLIIVVLLSGLLITAFSQTPTRWRGENGNGIYLEQGLLKSWPPGGPAELWSFEKLGKGHSSPVISQDFLYVTGLKGETGMLFKFDLEGNLIWEKAYGPEFSASFTGPRGSPVVVGPMLYIESGKGVIYCLSTADGGKIWEKNLFKDFDGSNITWGVNETPVVDGDIIYATPGGKNNNIVALNRHSGDLVWTSKGKGELSAYCTPLLIRHNGRKLLITHTASNLLGLDAASGELLWSQSQPNQYSVHANTPLYHNGGIFYFSGYGKGGGMLKLSQDGSSVSQVWYNEKLDSRMGGAVVLDGYIYTSGDYAREWRCVQWASGKEMYASSELGKGVVIYANGMLYCYTDRGEMALVKADPSEFKPISKFRVEKGSEQHWAHPVIHKGVLYVRHGSAIIAYKIK